MLGTVVAAVMVVAAAGATLTFAASGASAARAHKTSVQSPARAAKPTAAQTRAAFEGMLTGLQGVVVQMRANPLVAKSLKSTGTNLLPRLAAAQQEVANLDPAQLAQLQAILDKDPSWQQAPSTLSRAVASFDPAATPIESLIKGSAPVPTPSSVTSGSGTFTDDCASAGDPVAEDIAALAANEVQSALQAAALSAPGVIAVFPGIDAPTGIRLGLMVAWGVADGVYLALAQTEAVAVDCAQTAFGNTQSSVLPVDSSGTVIPTSSQVSIDALISKAGDTQTKISGVNTTVQTVETQTETVDTAVTNLNTVLNDITNRVDDVQSSLQTLQTNVDVLNNTEVTILKKSDTEIANLGSFQSLQLRMEIEDNLARNDKPLGILQLPAANGGYLEVVRSIVTDTLAKEAAVGTQTQNIARAQTFLDNANTAFAGGQYKLAFSLYKKAYSYAR